MAEISFRNVTKTFPNGKSAVRDFSLEIHSGEFLVLTGPQGSGKATVLRMIAGMEPISSGELRINGEIVENGKPEKRNMGMIFQHYTLYPGMTVRDNISFAMKLHQEPEDVIRRSVEETARIFKIENLLSCYPRELNELQKQYVAMARAHVHQPEAFLLLNPVRSLDLQARKKARNRLKELQEEIGTTLIYATDDAAEAAFMGTRTVIMRRGRIIQVGTAEELMENPCCFFVAQFMNEPGFGSGEVRIVKGKTAVEAVADNFSVDVPPEWIPRLEQAGYVGKRVLMGYTVSRPSDEEDMGCELLPDGESRFFFFDRETQKSIV
ncbi:ABC transporter ATP-binding protein [Fusibacillus kribbianus]|uniref:ABC transporter ATP-binding protein n=1 Tax=Fusibacillus kribbianus TaxID=3044208 RepID=A0AAP4BDI7_9FIRM|nr:ABC transporter ATP-binding protein [Ruminococcus sp. YH-rum2234]MDI9242871.1 ABC transporter ATP-binding protein [Ruminococcus sp. YH-rum2234]